jgi:hypothetical protein
MAELMSQLDQEVYNLACVDAPPWFINPKFKAAFSNSNVYNSLVESCTLITPSGLDSILASNNPPPHSFFLNLPRPKDEKFWAIYALWFTKEGETPKLYVGSGTSRDQGVEERLASYKATESLKLPRFVQQAFKNGFTLAHIGFLCWTPLPPDGLVPRLRARFLLLESLFTIAFNASFVSSADFYVQRFIRWSRESTSWNPLCSHLPLTERIRGGIDLSPEEVAALEVVRKARAHKKDLAKSQAYRARERAKDEVAYKAKVNADKAAYTEKNRDKVNKNKKNAVNKIKAAGTYRCLPCNQSFATPFALNLHRTRKTHTDRVAGIAPPPPDPYAKNRNARRQAIIDAATYSCTPCGKPFPSQFQLDRHLATSIHKRRAAAYTPPTD